MESHLLDILVCPLCKGPLQYDRPAQELICNSDKLAYPVRDGIPVMLESEARVINASTSSQTQAPTAGTSAAPSAPDAQS
ncbi:MAG TPA: Trm112 family protein [Pusillimonas sp.]|uniref:Trm112 family protein n=1 Tax=unclassified Pusillimonas TaxID=2640016 RepID=UPI002631797C|nr:MULTISPECIES: Trm112 family protein [unclassified Pusillimonas]HLU20621.1 Trm112 family protein [Pusillimonas sp.]